MGWELLPTEVVLKILCFVDINSLLTLRRVSKRFGYELTKDPFLWKQRCKLEFGVEPTQVGYRFYWIPLHHSKLLDDLFQKGWEWLYWSKRFDVHAQVLATKSCYGTPSKLMKEGVGYFTWCGKQFNSYYYEGQWALASSSSSENELLGRSKKKKKTSAGWLVATTGSEDLRRKGVGICRWTNGNVYVGQWHNDRMNGKGVMLYANDNRYEGEWLNNKRHGKGVLYYKDAFIYDGEWRDGTRCGFGTMTFVSGRTLVGTWRRNKFIVSANDSPCAPPPPLGSDRTTSEAKS